MKGKRIFAIVGLLVGIILFFIPHFTIKPLEENTKNYFHTTIEKAAVSYATIRLINAGVSIVKESDLSLEPGGVGINIAVGELLDPIDDMTERVADILVTVLVSLGISELSYEIFSYYFEKILAVLLVLFSLSCLLQRVVSLSTRDLLQKMIVITVVLRFVFPLSSWVNGYLYNDFFQPKIVEAKQALDIAPKSKESFVLNTNPEEGVLDVIEHTFIWSKQKAAELKDSFLTFFENADNIIYNLLKLAYLYVALFLIQVILLPLGVFYIMVKIINSLFDKNYSTMIHHKIDS